MKTAVWKRCTGEAHSNPHIDNCSVCSPFWARIACCPSCKASLRMAKSKDTGKCPNKHGSFTVDRDAPTLVETDKTIEQCPDCERPGSSYLNGYCDGCFAGSAE